MFFVCFFFFCLTNLKSFLAVPLKTITEMINYQGAFGFMKCRKKRYFLPREVSIIATEYITQHTSKDLENIPLQRLKGPLKHSAVCLVSDDLPLPDYCHLKGEQGCNNPQPSLEQEVPFKSEPSQDIRRVVENSEILRQGKELSGVVVVIVLVAKCVPQFCVWLLFHLNIHHLCAT